LTSYSAALFLSAAYSPPIRKDNFDHLDEVTMMTDFRTAKILSHRRNIQRYARLLATELTELERQYLHRRIAEEQAELDRLQSKPLEQVIATQAMGRRANQSSA
jgi:hypothetical protein